MTVTANITTRPALFFDNLILLELRRHTSRLSELEKMKKTLFSLEPDFIVLKKEGFDIFCMAASPSIAGEKLKLSLECTNHQDQRRILHALQQRGFEAQESYNENIFIITRENVEIQILQKAR